MYVETSTDTERPLVIDKVIEDIPGGGVITAADFPSTTEEFKEGSLVGVDSNGLFHSIKTVAIVAGGSASAPRIDVPNELKVDDVISDGVVALTIATIVDSTTYMTLTFDSGQLTIFAEGTILYQVLTEDTTGGGTDAEATVQDTAGDYLTCEVPVTQTPEDFNGVTMTIEQAGDDVLAVAYADGVLTISLANTTAANNNIAAIQTIVRALGTVEGLDWSGVVFSGIDWDDKQTGTTLTTPSDDFQGGVNYDSKSPIYSGTQIGISMNTVDLSKANTGSGILVRGTVRENLMTYPVSTYLKGLLSLIRFIS